MRWQLLKIGDKFSSLQILSFPKKTKKGKISYQFAEVKCDCGVIFLACSSSLRTGITKRCINCAMKEREKNKRITPQLEQLYKQKILARCAYCKFECDLTIEEFGEIISKDCYYCGKSPVPSVKFKKRKYNNTKPFLANTVDRIDSSKGYTKSNCLPCCKTCNTMKMNLSLEEFLCKINKLK